MLAAIIWWAVLLNRQNEMLNELNHNKSSIATMTDYDYSTVKTMIQGEAVVFCLALIIGIWLIYRSYNQALVVARQKNNFLLSVTHELKSPLTGISLNVEALKHDKSLDQGQITSLEFIEKETLRLDRLISNILKATPSSLVRKPKALHDFSSDVETIIQTEYSSYNIELEKSLHPIKLEYNKEDLQIILTNLIDNAIKYSKDTAKVKVLLEEHDSSISLSVFDNAAIIPSQEQKLIFQQFYRIGNEETRSSKGVGLGLYLVKQTLDAMGGSIAINTSSFGNVFQVNLKKND